MVAGLTQAQGKKHSACSGVSTQFPSFVYAVWSVGLHPESEALKPCFIPAPEAMFFDGRVAQKGIYIFSFFH